MKRGEDPIHRILDIIAYRLMKAVKNAINLLYEVVVAFHVNATILYVHM